MTTDPRGYYPKFSIQRNDGRPLPWGAEWFVLMISHDRHARRAALAYAESIEPENQSLAQDLRALVARHGGVE